MSLKYFKLVHISLNIVLTLYNTSISVGDFANYKMISEIYEAQLERMYLLTCAPKDDSNQPAHPNSQISLRCLHDDTLGYPKMRTMKILNAQDDLNPRWAHMSEGTFSDVTANVY